MNTPLKVGDRVAAYQDGRRYLGVVTKIMGVVLEVGLKEGSPVAEMFLHRNQCRRIKPKRKAREYVIHLAPGEMPRVCSYAEFMLPEKAVLPHPKTNEFVHVREVIKPKEKK